MKSILILQNEIMEYRKPVYNGLAEHYEVTVLHSGSPSVRDTDKYREIITPKKKIWRFNMQLGSPLNRIIHDFDAVIAMFDLAWPAYLAPLFLKRRPKYILWGHWYSTNPLANFARDFLMKRADRLLMYGGEEIERMAERGIDRNRIVEAPNTVHVPNHKDHSEESKNSLLFVGRLQAGSRRNSKRADILIETFSNLQGRIRDDIVVNIIGKGEEQEPLKQLAAKRGISDKVFFHGHVDDDRTLNQFFRKAIAFVSPGHVGLSVLQSFAHGLPVVTGKAIQLGWQTQHLENMLTGQPVIIGPEYYNLVHGKNALLMETQDDMEKMIEKLCNNNPYAAELGHNAYQHYVKERPLSRMIAGFRKAIEK